jgi:hypothetical protein
MRDDMRAAIYLFVETRASVEFALLAKDGVFGEIAVQHEDVDALRAIEILLIHHEHDLDMVVADIHNSQFWAPYLYNKGNAEAYTSMFAGDVQHPAVLVSLLRVNDVSASSYMSLYNLLNDAMFWVTYVVRGIVAISKIVQDEEE